MRFITYQRLIVLGFIIFPMIVEASNPIRTTRSNRTRGIVADDGGIRDLVTAVAKDAIVISRAASNTIAEGDDGTVMDICVSTVVLMRKVSKEELKAEEIAAANGEYLPKKEMKEVMTITCN